MDEDVVDAVVHQVFANGVVDPGLNGNEHLRAHAIGTHDQHGIRDIGGDAQHTTKRAGQAPRELGARGGDRRDDPALGALGGVEVHAGLPVAVGHVPPVTGGMSNRTSSPNARTRSLTSSGVRSSNRPTENSSTANEPMALP